MVSFLEVATTFPYNIAQGREYTKSIESFALYYSLAYVVVIFAVKAVMANAKPFDVRFTIFLSSMRQRLNGVPKLFPERD